MRPRVRLGFWLWGLLALGVAATASPSQDPLWRKAVATAARAEEAGVRFGGLEMETVVTKRNGEVDQRSRIVMAVVGEGEAERVETVSAVVDGKDVTEQAQRAEREARAADAAETRKGGGDDGATLRVQIGYHPFAAAEQGRVTARRLGPETLNGVKVERFAFRHAAGKKQAVEGTAWLDAETGVPLQIAYSPDPLPRFADAMVTRARFELSPEGYWRPLEEVRVGDGSLLFIYRKVESTTRFTRWRLGPPEPESSAAARK